MSGSTNGQITALQSHIDNGQQLLVPKKMFFTKGVGSHKHELRSFEIALRDAGIEKCNIVHVSSIFPPNCELISKNEGQKFIYPGMITFAVTARSSSNEARRLIAASIGCAIPSDPNTYGYLSEYYAFGQTEKEAGDTAEDLAAAVRRLCDDAALGQRLAAQARKWVEPYAFPERARRYREFLTTVVGVG